MGGIWGIVGMMAAMGAFELGSYLLNAYLSGGVDLEDIQREAMAAEKAAKRTAMGRLAESERRRSRSESRLAMMDQAGAALMPGLLDPEAIGRYVQQTGGGRLAPSVTARQTRPMPRPLPGAPAGAPGGGPQAQAQAGGPSPEALAEARRVANPPAGSVLELLFGNEVEMFPATKIAAMLGAGEGVA